MRTHNPSIHVFGFIAIIFFALLIIPGAAHAGAGNGGFTAGGGSSSSQITTGTWGGGGGSPFSITCPDGSAMTGISGRAGKFVDYVRLACTSGLGGATGGGGGSPYTLSCPSGDVAIGIHGRFGGYVDALGLVCSSGSQTAVAGGGGGTSRTLLCPSGYSAVGLYGRSARWLDAAGVVCQKNSEPAVCDDVSAECPAENDDVCANLDGVQSSVPVGYQQSGSQCVFSGCSDGYSYQNGQCVITLECPSGYLVQNNQCVRNCGSGYTRVGNQCVRGGGPLSCLFGAYCVGDDVYYRDARCDASFVKSCPFGCVAGGCINPFDFASISARPSLVRQGGVTEVSWLLDIAKSVACTVTGTNGDSWGGKSGTQTSSGITGETTYTLTCADQDLKQVTVRVIPNWRER